MVIFLSRPGVQTTVNVVSPDWHNTDSAPSSHIVMLPSSLVFGTQVSWDRRDQRKHDGQTTVFKFFKGTWSIAHTCYIHECTRVACQGHDSHLPSLSTKLKQLVSDKTLHHTFVLIIPAFTHSHQIIQNVALTSLSRCGHAALELMGTWCSEHFTCGTSCLKFWYPRWTRLI